MEKTKALSKRLESIIDNIHNEESTKTSVIMPFFQLLGYDVFNPNEFFPEFTADVGIKKGEKVDYAILKDGQPLILIEAKSITDDLKKHDSQLFRYFGTTSVKFAILTNGEEYRFYTDLDETNKMDEKPFFIFNLLDLKENKVHELYKFKKNTFDVNKILDTASELKYSNEIKQLLEREIDNPSDEFVYFLLADIYSGKKTKNVIEHFKDIVKKSMKQFINEQVNDKLQAALNTTKNDEPQNTNNDDPEGNDNTEDTPQIITTEEEIEGYVYVKLILNTIIDQDRIFYRDNLSYFNILIDDNIRKWVCRLGLNNPNHKYIQMNDDDKTVYKINEVSEIANYKNELLQVVHKFIK